MKCGMSNGWWRRVVLVLLGGLAWMPLLCAAAVPAQEPPVRVARVSWLAGTANVSADDGQSWQPLVVNRPLIEGDQLAAGAAARVELQLGDGVMHLDHDTDATLTTLAPTLAQVALQRGTLQLDAPALPDGQRLEIDTPQIVVVVDRDAAVRVDLGDGAASIVSVRRGSVIVHGGQGAQRVLRAGQRYRFAGPELADAQAQAAGGDDAFGAWCRARDAQYASGSLPAMASDMVGYRDLAHYGQWVDEGDDGQVWFPEGVDADWAPYRQGRWINVAPWGWTWLSSEPWGFAPFHYGRWAQFDGRWGWLPEPYGVPAVYAPALVGFFGGDGWQVSIGFNLFNAPIGWYPLAPGMIYNPWYHAGWRYYRRINRGDGHWWRRHHAHHAYPKQRLRKAYDAWRKPRRVGPIHFTHRPPHGITVVSRGTFARGHAVAGHRLHVSTSHLRTAPWRLRGSDLAKVREARRPHARHAPVPAVGMNRRDPSRPAHPVRVATDHRATPRPRRVAPVRRPREANLPRPMHLRPAPRSPSASHATLPAVRRLHAAHPRPARRAEPWHAPAHGRAAHPVVRHPPRRLTQPTWHPPQARPTRPTMRRAPRPAVPRARTWHPVARPSHARPAHHASKPRHFKPPKARAASH
ncbi:MAG TPA: DUF6600 domain-containing protein [Rhodanobacteraceae bacterium]